MGLEHVWQGEARTDVTVQQNNVCRTVLHDVVPEAVEPSSRPARLILPQIPDRDPELVGDGGDVERELPLLVEPDEVYLRQVGDAAARGDVVVHHGLAGEREERLGHVERQRPEPRPFGGAADHDDGDDALLGAGHGCARRLGGGAEPESERRCGRAGVVTGEI